MEYPEGCFFLKSIGEWRKLIKGLKKGDICIKCLLPFQIGRGLHCTWVLKTRLIEEKKFRKFGINKKDGYFFRLDGSSGPMWLKSKRIDIFASENCGWSAHLRVRLHQATITLPRIQIYFGDALDISKIFYKLGQSRPTAGKAQQDRGARIQSGGYILGCSQRLT